MPCCGWGVFDRNSRAPLAKVPVEVALLGGVDGGRLTLASFTTDKNGVGSPQFQLPDWDAGDYQLQITARPAAAVEVVTRPIELTRSWKLMLSSDKPLYKPGQTIHLRALALQRPDLKPVTGAEAVFSIADPKGNVVFRRQDVTSKFGITSADFVLATEINEGSYQIECQVGDTTSQRTVEVQKYVLPKFKVTVAFDQPYYQPGDRMRGTIGADYFFGKPVAGGEVSVAVRSAGFDALSLDPIELKTDDDGRAEFDFLLPQQLFGREQDDGEVRVQIVATVTDSAGQTYSAGGSRRVTSEPIHLEIIPESGTLVKGIANTVYIYAAYADGRPAAVRLVVSGIGQELATNKLGVASFELTPQSNGTGLTVKATDDDGKIGRKHVELVCGTVSDDFLVRPDKAVYDGGDTLAITALGGGVEPVFVDFVKDGQTMLSQMIDMQAGKGAAQIDLPADLFGTLRLVAYRFGSGGLAVRKERAIVVRQARELTIKAELDAKEYRPGERAQIKLALTDDAGKPVAGAISLAAVDEAVFSVLGQANGMEQVFFLLEEELLEPVYTIYNGWSPEPLRDIPPAERDTFNRALFSRTASSTSGGQAMPVALRAASVAGGIQVYDDIDDGPADWDEMAVEPGFDDDFRRPQ